MAVELMRLYVELPEKYNVKLHTNSCFDKTIVWMHMVEEIDFIQLLHGDELVFNSGLSYQSEKWLKTYITELNKVHAGGLIISFRDNRMFSQDIIDYCNAIRFPIFSASWDTPYIDIMRLFAEILLKNEQRETNLITAFKNAIFYPQNEELYLSHFERNGFFRNMSYAVIMLSCHAYDSDTGNEKLTKIEKSLRYIFKNVIVYEEKGRLTILTASYPIPQIEKECQKFCQDDPNVYIGIGTLASRITDIHRSYENAYTAYDLTKTAIPKNLLSYDELGIYKLLADVKEKSIYPAFVQETLGKLMEYDKEQETNYMEILEAYFENECSIIHTSQALYCHKNTLTYKLNKIKEVLGYDILSNENRTKIMVAIYILRLGTGFF
ncbi:PucR family transcriptional regulator [Bariatricus sp. SGI.154]|uniref:PucR family transcriptional regulator n=1 Tax=Bariatricus sp. SGI.154 TaxID=3420549 RepID=UPI003D010EC0